MPDGPPILPYSARRDGRRGPSSNDVAVALLTVLAVMAGVIGLGGAAVLALLCVKPDAFGPPDYLSPSFFVLSALFYGGGLVLACVGARLAWRRARKRSRDETAARVE